jgi:hypothetical protein
MLMRSDVLDGVKVTMPDYDRWSKSAISCVEHM